jgi:hypothetical protein
MKLLFWFVIGLVAVWLGHVDLLGSEASSVQWSYCSADMSLYSLDNVNFTFSPDRLVAGQNFTVNASALLHRTVPNATLVANLSLSGLVVREGTVPLCDSPFLTPSECPLKEGPLALFYSGALPPETPTGSYRARLTLLDEKLTTFGCVKINFAVEP